jgi:two-component sensor histidine kinase
MPIDKQPSAIPAPGSAAAVLVIDDDTERHGVYRAVLGDLVRHIETASSADAAKRLRGQAFTLVVIHLDAPAGAAARPESAVAHALEIADGTPIVFISSSGLDFLALGRVHPGSHDYLPAPIVPDVLRNKVVLFLELAQLRAEAREQMAAAAELKGLVSEQVHRGKNLLAIIQSITLRTIRDGRDLGEARGALVGRLRALARAYDLLSAANSRGTLLADIVEAELREIADRVSATGPAVRLTGSFAQTFALAVHELATNAIRHGALRAKGGTVTVGWTLFETGADRYLEVGWTEQGGPPVARDPRHGFGLTLISLATSDSRGANFSFDGEGFACRLRLPHEMLVMG